MIISIASITVNLIFSREFHSQLEEIRGRFAGYLLNDNTSSPIDFKLHITPSKKRSVGLHNRTKHSFYATRSYWVIIHHTSRCTISWDKSWGIMQFWGGHDRLYFALQDYLKFIIACKTIMHGGLPMHSSAVARHGRALIFFGPSGIGKTTISSLLAPSWQLLNDEFNIILPDGHSGYTVHSTPFTKLENLPLCSSISGRLTGLFALNQAPANRISTCSIQQGIFALTACCYTIPTTDAFGGMMLETLHKLSQRAGVRQLFFINNYTILQDIEHFIDH